MQSERVLRRIEHFLDEAEDAVAQKNWALVRENARAVLALDPENRDARTFLAGADRALAPSEGVGVQGLGDRGEAGRPHPTPLPEGEGTSTPSLALTGEGGGVRGQNAPGQQPRGEADGSAAPMAVGPADAHPLGGGLGAEPPAEMGRVGGPSSFCNGRYQVVRFLGEGAKKRVFQVHDARLDRDVAFALIKTDGLDEEGRARIRREAQAMGRLGDHPHVVAVFDIGDEPSGGSGQGGQPYIVSQLMAGGDLEKLLANAEDHRLPLDHALSVADQVCQALEHAHQHGVIHRDLKPGNVWVVDRADSQGGTLDSDLPSGSRLSLAVKLGDFGLAVSLDRSRLTQAGMMVGTAAYMPPEQAMGGPVDPRSDLYSLGAMLYEMVTGRPPFVGDDTIAVIGQHLNAPPVVPSWHRPDLPAAMEALILRLLEKDPTKRPGSAAEVRQLLAGAIAPTPPPTVGERQGERASSPTAANPIYQHTFVGREAELRQLKAAFDGSISGRGGLFMVVGEPGIGKTSLCEQLATYAALRGGRTLVGHCYEEGSLSLPYLAFVEAMRTYVLGREPDGLKEDLGTGAADVARIVSEIRDRVAVEPRPPGDPEDDRWRLLQAVTSFLRNTASVRPILLVLEDLHWADRGTLDLLIHLVRNLAGARLLVVATYRGVEVDRAHPLSAALAELRRVGELPRVLLPGLTPDEVHRMINSISSQEVRWSLAEAVHRQTEGNPLFVQEVVRFMVEEGLIVRQEGRWEGRWRQSGEALPELSIPEGLRDVIGRRLSRLSAECNRLLAIAAVIGREFELRTLEAVAQVGEEDVLTGIEEAMRVGVLEEQTRPGSVRYRFAHAFFRQTLYEEMIAPRRLRLHQQIARALEAFYSPESRLGGEQQDPLTPPGARPAGRLEEHAAELAEHFGQSTDPGDLARAVQYAELAARRASAAYAYPEAVRLLDRALQVQEVVDPDDTLRRCDLLLALGEALLPAGEPRRAADETAEEAFQLAEAVDDRRRASRACQLALTGLRNYGGSVVARTAAFREWAERADRWAEPNTVERVHADLALSRAGSLAEVRLLVSRALELARRLGDSAALFEVARSALLPAFPPRQMEEQRQLADEAVQWSRAGVGTRTLGTALFWGGLVLRGWGERERAEALWNEVVDLAARTRDPALQLYAMDPEVHTAVFDGRLEEAVGLGERLVARADELGSPVLGRQRRLGATAMAWVWLGRAEEALAALAEQSEAGEGAIRDPFRALCLAHLGRRDEVQRILDDQMRDLRARAPEELPSTSTLCHLLETAVLLEDRAAAAALCELLRGVAECVLSDYSTCIARNLGAAAALLGKPDEARAYYQQALELCERLRFRPEIALTRLQLAELLLEELPVASSGLRGPGPAPTPSPPPSLGEGQGERAQTLREAQAHLDFAIGEFQAMKMQPSLERALRLKQTLEVKA